MSVSAGTRTRVLVVEDEQDIAGLVKHTLEKMGGLEVDVVDTGDAALRVVAEREPDLILLDLNLPVLSGLEVCRILRARPATARTGELIPEGACRRPAPGCRAGTVCPASARTSRRAGSDGRCRHACQDAGRRIGRIRLGPGDHMDRPRANGRM
jgi:CheY-like chemotaxis protein